MSRYVQPPCTDFMPENTLEHEVVDYSYMTWIFLGSQCKANVNTPMKCRYSNSMMVMEGAIENNIDGDDNDYYSCWTVESRSSVLYYIDDDGNLVLRIGQIACCPAGGDVGETDSIPVDIKFTVGDQDDVTVTNTESLRSCDNNSKPVDISIKMSSAKYKGIRVYNYTTPVVRCVVVNNTNSSKLGNDSIMVTLRDVIQCSLHMEVSAERTRCILRHSSASLALSVTCPDGVSRVHELNMSMLDSNYSKSVYVSDISDPGCTIQVFGQYLQPLASNWTETRVEGNAFYVTAADLKTSTESTVWIAPIAAILTIIIIIAAVVVVRYFWLRHKRNRHGHRNAHDVSTDTLELVSEQPHPPMTENDTLENSRSTDEADQLMTTSDAQQDVVKVSCLFSEKDSWVKQELFPKLELDKRIRLKKYPVVGQTKPDAIVKQVKGSSRIIIIISHNYLNEEMSGYAIIKALMETIKNSNVNIIPIHLDDSCVPEVIIHYCCLHINSDNFWNRLLEAVIEDKQILTN